MFATGVWLASITAGVSRMPSCHRFPGKSNDLSAWIDNLLSFHVFDIAINIACDNDKQFIYDTISFASYDMNSLILWTPINNPDCLSPLLPSTNNRRHHSSWVWVRTREDLQLNNSVWWGILQVLFHTSTTHTYSVWYRHSPRPQHRAEHTCFSVADGFVVVVQDH